MFYFYCKISIGKNLRHWARRGRRVRSQSLFLVWQASLALRVLLLRLLRLRLLLLLLLLVQHPELRFSIALGWGLPRKSALGTLVRTMELPMCSLEQTRTSLAALASAAFLGACCCERAGRHPIISCGRPSVLVHRLIWALLVGYGFD